MCHPHQRPIRVGEEVRQMSKKVALWVALGVAVLHLISDGEATVKLLKQLR